MADAKSEGNTLWSLWDKAVEQVSNVFRISSLYEEQKEALRKFFSKQDVFVNLPTCYGKSLIFQATPIMADVLFRRSTGTSTVVVISPLKALMEDQVRYLKKLNLSAVCVTDEHNDKLVRDIINGEYTHVYGSPECLLTSTWRGIFSSKQFRASLVCVAVDEAHCISQWGLPGARRGELPFRKWYGNLGELRSLVPDDVKMLVATASATKETRAVIYESLKLTNNTSVVSKSPDRSNLQYCLQYIDKDIPLDLLFAEIIEDIKAKSRCAERTIIYCQTRKQCAILYRVFETVLGNSFYKDAVPNCKNRLVEMYHAGTPQAVKHHISKNLSKEKGHIRVLISTIAFGMGIDCKQVNKIIHFGPSKNVECYIQESGRAGRDGSPSNCILLFNGLLSTHCSQDMKELLQSETDCRRELLMKTFGFTHVTVNKKHSCCDNCAKVCECGEEDCTPIVGLIVPETTNMDEAPALTRPVSYDQKKLLKAKLKSFRNDLIKEHKQQMINTVSLPTVLLEFGYFQIFNVLKNCHKIFNICDVLKYVEVWRERHAHGILTVINDVFDDISDIPVFAEVTEADEIMGDMDWEEICNDSTLLSMVDSQDQDMDDTQDESVQGSLNTSSFFLNLTSVNL